MPHRHSPSADSRHGISTLAGVTAITALYIYFLIFAEFAFIEQARLTVGEGGLRYLLALLGLAGICGSLLAAYKFKLSHNRRPLAAGFIGCALAASLSLVSGHAIIAFICAVLVGGCLGWTTVTLSLCLRPTLHLKNLGFYCGIGTGLAYAFCNQPPVFTGSLKTQIALAIFAALVGFSTSFKLRSEPDKASNSHDYHPGISVIFILLFLVLVWLDSAAFFIIQHNPALKAETWQNTLALQGNAFVHLCAAVLAGIALDRRQLALTLGVALLALMGACLLLTAATHYHPAARAFYTAGASIYSTALVFYPARGGRPWLAGILFAVSGWFGSAAGIGMVQSLHAIPRSFVLIVALVASAAFIARHFWLKQLRATLVITSVLLTAVLTLPPPAEAAENLQPIRGREVYIGEGCIHCHSQYVRPQTSDVPRWGPETTLTEALNQNPPLFGNRRQGPDLAQIGNRRSPEWNRLHLIAPRQVSPGSRMPSYAHLFRQGNSQGDDLVAYLQSLGNETIAARLSLVQTWQPEVNTKTIPQDQSRALFKKLCASCHGTDGRGNGPLATKLSLHPPDFTREPWRQVKGTDVMPELARIIKFGLPASPMAGHEYLSDREVISLAAYIASLHRT